MKKMIVFLLVLLAAVWLGVKFFTEPGFLIVGYGLWTVEMPLWLAGAITVVVFVLLYGLLRLFAFVGGLKRRLRFWRKERGWRRAYQQTTQGLLDLAEGKWWSAEKCLIGAARYQQAPLINYLGAARAAQEQEAYERRDDYLRAAYQVNPRAEVAIGLTQAELQLSHHQLEHCLASLRHLQTLVPQHTHVLKLLKGLYCELNDWDSLLALLPTLQKRHVITQQEALQLECDAYLHLLQKAQKLGDNVAFMRIWQQLPQRLSRNGQLVYCYATQLIESGELVEAERVLHAVIQRQWDDNLVTLYALTDDVKSNKQLKVAEAWLKDHPNNPHLLFCLGRLSVKAQLWGKAKYYLSQAVTLSNDPAIYREFGQLLEQLGEQSEALKIYRAGLS